MTHDSLASHSELRIEGEMTIYRAEELKRALIGPLLNAEQLEVDLSGVTEVDSVGLQLLLLAKRTARTLQGELRLVGHSPAVLEVFDLLKLAAYFGDHLVIPARSASATA
jgi:anti-sigma B factor antagonist